MPRFPSREADDAYTLFHRDGAIWVTDLAGSEQQLTTDGGSRIVSTWVSSVCRAVFDQRGRN